MAEFIKVFTLKINGVDTAVTTMKGLKDATKQLNDELDNTDVGSKRFREIQQELKKAEKLSSDFGKTTSQQGNILTKAFGGVKNGISQAAQSVGGFLKAFGPIALVIAGIQKLIELLKEVEPVADFIEEGLTAVTEVLKEILAGVLGIGKAIVQFFTGDFKEAAETAGKALDRFTLENLGKAIDRGREFAQLQDEITDAIIEFSKANAVATREIERLLIAQKNRTLTAQETLALLKQIGEIEIANSQQAIAIAQKQLQLAEAKLAASRAQNSIDGQAGEAARKAQADAFVNLQNTLRESEAVRERVANRIALKEREILEQRLEREQKAFNLEREFAAGRAQFQLEKLDLQLQQREDYQAKLERIEIAAQRQLLQIQLDEEKAINDIRTRRAKGEEVSAKEEEKILREASERRRVIRLQAAQAIQKELDEIEKQRREALLQTAEAEIGALKKVRDNVGASVSERLAAEANLKDIQEARIRTTLAGELDVAKTVEQQAAAYAKANAALKELDSQGLTPAVAKAQQLSAALTGIGEPLVNAFTSITQIIAGFNESALQGIQQQLQATSEAIAQAESEINQSRERQAELQDELANADAASRQRIIQQIQQQRKVERDAQNQKAKAEAEAAALEKRKRDIQRENAVLQKAAALASAIVSTAQSIATTIGQTGFFGIPLAAIVGAIGAAQVAAIAAQPLPAFARGGFTGGGQGRPDATGYRVAGVVHENEYVVPAYQVGSPKYRGAIEFLESGRQKGYAQGGPVGDAQGFDSQGGSMDAIALTLNAVQALAERPVVVNVQEITDKQRQVANVQAVATL